MKLERSDSCASFEESLDVRLQPCAKAPVQKRECNASQAYDSLASAFQDSGNFMRRQLWPIKPEQEPQHPAAIEAKLEQEIIQALAQQPAVKFPLKIQSPIINQFLVLNPVRQIATACQLNFRPSDHVILSDLNP